MPKFEFAVGVKGTGWVTASNAEDAANLVYLQLGQRPSHVTEIIEVEVLEG